MKNTNYGTVYYTDGQDHNWFGAKLVIWDEPIIGQNASTIYWEYYVWMTSANLTPYKYKYGNKVTFELDNKTIVNTTNYGAHDPTGHVGEANALLYAKGSTTVEHNEDGTKGFVYHFVYDQTQSSTLDKVSIPGTHICTPIIRSSILNATDGEMGAEQTLTISRPNSAYTDTVSYYFNSSIKGVIAEKTTETSLKWTPDAGILQLYPSANELACTYTIDTYDGDTLVGSSTKTVSLSVPSDATVQIPEGALTLTAGNYNTALSGVTDFIQYVTYLTARANTGILGDQYGAFVTNTKISFNEYSNQGNSLPVSLGLMNTQLTKVGTNIVVYTFTNSRGKTYTVEKAFEVKPYEQPFIAGLKANRCNVDGELMSNGWYIYLEGTPNVVPYGTNTATVTYELQLNGATVVAATTTPIPAVIGGGMVDPKNSYTLVITVKDSLLAYQARTYVVDIPDESIPFHIKRNGKAVGIGAYALDDGTLNIGYELLKDGVPFGGGSGAEIKAGAITIGSFTSNCYYLKSEKYAIVFISTGYLMAATGTGSNTITLPTELHGFTGGAGGAGVVWSTGNFQLNVTLTANSSTKNSLYIYGSNAMTQTVGLGQQLIGWIILYY